MKAKIKIIKDELPMTREKAFEMAEKLLKQGNHFAAVYGEKTNGNTQFYTPVLVDEKSLKEMTEGIMEKDPEGSVYVVYRSNVTDAPIYEIEYKNGEAYIDIPEEEINEFIKNRLIQIANNPRLIQKYRFEIEDLLGKELEEYANQQFYEQGRGKVVEDDIEIRKNGDKYFYIHYDNLDINIDFQIPSIHNMPAEWVSEEIQVDYDYYPEDIKVLEIIDNYLSKQENRNIDYDELDYNEWSELCEKYKEGLKPLLEPFAQKEAEDYFNEMSESELKEYFDPR